MQVAGLDDELFSLIATRRHVGASAPRTDVDAHTSRWYVGSNASQWTVKNCTFMHSVRSSTSLLGNTLYVSRLKALYGVCTTVNELYM